MVDIILNDKILLWNVLLFQINVMKIKNILIKYRINLPILLYVKYVKVKIDKKNL